MSFCSLHPDEQRKKRPREPLTDLADFERHPDAAWGSVLHVNLGKLAEEAGARPFLCVYLLLASILQEHSGVIIPLAV